ncbi:MAG: ribonuclease P protein component [Bacteroidales bacterium]|nr:ribonuclease P protein component [Bacteroidales bacterium]
MFTFDKSQRLNSRKRIGNLFSEGGSFLVWPLSVRYITTQGQGEASVVIICPKRYQKLAVRRNRMKRLMRETYRKNSIGLKTCLKQNRQNMDIAFTFVSEKTVNYNHMESLMVQALTGLQQKAL